jgi:hypothetical protein
MKAVMRGIWLVTLSRSYQTSNTSEIEMRVWFLCIATGIQSSINYERSPNTITILIFVCSVFPFRRILLQSLRWSRWRIPLLLWQWRESGSSKYSLCFRFPHQYPYAPLLSSIRATFSAHLILDLITRIIFVVATGHKTPHYEVFNSPLVPRPS